MEMYRQYWWVENAKATILLVHGAGEHSGRYQHVAQYFNQHGYAVVSGDLPGLGRSPGVPGHVDSFADYTTVIHHWITQLFQQVAAAHPIFILGHSMGGLIATRFVQQFAEQERLSGLLLSSPCFQLKLRVPPWQKGAVRILNRIWPTLRLSNRIEAHQVSRDPQIVSQYKTDPLTYHKVSIRWFCELEREMQAAQQAAKQIFLPLLVLQAGNDQIVEPAAASRFVQQVASTDKQFICWQELYHELFNEPERTEVLAQAVAWIEQRIHNQPCS